MANVVALLLGVYAAAGALFAAAFVARGARRLDRNVEGAPWTFRLVIAPGAVALWPLLLSQWLRQERGEP
jgi:hypothetical protein